MLSLAHTKGQSDVDAVAIIERKKLQILAKQFFFTIYTESIILTISVYQNAILAWDMFGCYSSMHCIVVIRPLEKDR